MEAREIENISVSVFDLLLTKYFITIRKHVTMSRLRKAILSLLEFSCLVIQ